MAVPAEGTGQVDGATTGALRTACITKDRSWDEDGHAVRGWARYCHPGQHPERPAPGRMASPDIHAPSQDLRLPPNADPASTVELTDFAIVLEGRSGRTKLAREVYKDNRVERWEVCGLWRPLFECLEQVPDPRLARGVRHPFQDSASDPAGPICGQTTMAHIALFARMKAGSEGALGVSQGSSSPRHHHSRALAGVSHERCRALTGWVMVADRELNASVDGKWAKSSGPGDGRAGP